MKQIDFSRRSYDKEMLDDFEVTGADLFQNLKELRFINKYLGGNAVSINALKKLKLDKNKSYILADVGCGGGDMLFEINKVFKKSYPFLKLIGLDANKNILDFAEQQKPVGANIDFKLSNVLNPSTIPKVDIANFTLFCHHFSENELISIFKHFQKVGTKILVINDLHRHPLAYYSIAYLTRWFSKSVMVKNDAKLSVLRGFSKKEMDLLMSSLAPQSYRLKWKWAFRWQLIIYF